LGFGRGTREKWFPCSICFLFCFSNGNKFGTGKRSASLVAVYNVEMGFGDAVYNFGSLGKGGGDEI